MGTRDTEIFLLEYKNPSKLAQSASDLLWCNQTRYSEQRSTSLLDTRADSASPTTEVSLVGQGATRPPVGVDAPPSHGKRSMCHGLRKPHSRLSVHLHRSNMLVEPQGQLFRFQVTPPSPQKPPLASRALGCGDRLCNFHRACAHPCVHAQIHIYACIMHTNIHKYIHRFWAG